MDFFNWSHVFLYDHLLTSQRHNQDPFQALAFDEVLLKQASQEAGDQLHLHLWQLPKAVILGMTDTKTPHLDQGLAYLKGQGYLPLVRSAGGLAVVADPGILNISLIFKKDQAITIDQAYQALTDLLVACLPQAQAQGGIVAGEIPQSYCPGSFDLSIQGRKFAGLAQRRYKEAICVSAYLSIDGDQTSRGQLIQNFYQAALQGQVTKWHFPDVDPYSMANLQDLMQVSWSQEDMVQSLVDHLLGPTTLMEEKDLAPILEGEAYQTALSRFKQRNAHI